MADVKRFESSWLDLYVGNGWSVWYGSLSKSLNFECGYEVKVICGVDPDSTSIASGIQEFMDSEDYKKGCE